MYHLVWKLVKEVWHLKWNKKTSFMELVHTKCLPTSLTICLCWQPPPYIVPKCPWLLKTVFCVWVVCVSSHMYVFLGCHFLEKCLAKGFIRSMSRYFRSFALQETFHWKCYKPTHCWRSSRSLLPIPPPSTEMPSKRLRIYHQNTCCV